MAYDVSATLQEEQVKLSGTHPIDMYILNSSLTGWNPLYYCNLNQDIFGYAALASGVFTATGDKTYTGLPIQREEIKNSTDGQISEVSVSVPNTDRSMESVIQSNNYLRGCEVYILSGFVKHLPSGSTAKHIGSSADRFAFIKEKLYIDNTSSDENVVTFSCKPKFLIKNMVLPGRMYTRDCSWAMKGRYRGTECLGGGSISATTFPHCDGTLDNCRARSNESRFGGFPGVPRRGSVIIS